MQTVALLFAIMAAALVVFLGAAEVRWRSQSRVVRDQLLRPGGALPAVVDFTQLDSLPKPVQRYLRAVLRDGQPLIRRVHLTQEGEFLVRPESNGWGSFTAVHDIVPSPAGFIWDARIRMAPGISVRVRDSFVNGQGEMFGSLLAVFQVMKMGGTAEMATASLQRYLAEAVWAPTALLPSAGVSWVALSDSSARASLTVAGTTVSLDFFFGADGLVNRVFSEARGRAVDGKTIPTPWQGRWLEYAERAGMRVPVSGEVEWLLAAGPQPYWRGRLESYEVTPPPTR